MSVKITFEVNNCFECPFHEIHKIVMTTLIYEAGIYCSLVEDDDNNYWHDTYDGWVAKRLIVSDKQRSEKYAEVPIWCPFSMKPYEALIDSIHNMETWQYFGEPCESILGDYAVDLLDQLSKYSFEQFSYCHQSDYTTMVSVERDKALTMAIALFFKALYKTPSTLAHNEYIEILETSEIPQEDKDSIMSWLARLIGDVPSFSKRKFKWLKKQSKKAGAPKIVLSSETMIELVMYLADKLAYLSIGALSVKYNVLRDIAELYILMDDLPEPRWLDLNQRVNKKIIGLLHSASTSFLGLKFKLFINDKEINLRRYFTEESYDFDI